MNIDWISVTNTPLIAGDYLATNGRKIWTSYYSCASMCWCYYPYYPMKNFYHTLYIPEIECEITHYASMPEKIV